MTVVCPRGHQSEATDYCDQCGAPIVEEADTSPAARREPCPACGAPRSGDDRYCESCGHDFLGPPPATVDVGGDRHGRPCPVRPPRGRRRVVPGRLPGAALCARRRREPDRAQPRRQPDEQRARDRPRRRTPVDPGVSRLHAVLERRATASASLRDLGSTNGTMVNDDPVPIAPQTAVPLADGDRVRVGAWTTITVRKR